MNHCCSWKSSAEPAPQLKSCRRDPCGYKRQTPFRAPPAQRPVSARELCGGRRLRRDYMQPTPCHTRHHPVTLPVTVGCALGACNSCRASGFDRRTADKAVMTMNPTHSVPTQKLDGAGLLTSDTRRMCLAHRRSCLSAAFRKCKDMTGMRYTLSSLSVQLLAKSQTMRGTSERDELGSEERHTRIMLLVQPQTLKFCEPNLTSCCCVLLQNASAYGSVSFRTKTTAPDAYLVTPARGVMPFQASITINVFVQPRKTPPSELNQFLLEARCSLGPSVAYYDVYGSASDQLTLDNANTAQSAFGTKLNGMLLAGNAHCAAV